MLRIILLVYASMAVAHAQEYDEIVNCTSVIDERGWLQIDPEQKGLCWSFPNRTKLFLAVEEQVLTSAESLFIQNSSQSHIMDVPGQKGPYTLWLEDLEEFTVHLNLTSTKHWAKKFKAYFNVENCSYIVHSDISILASPQYIPKKGSRKTCNFVLSNNDGFKISMGFRKLNLMNSSLTINTTEAGDPIVIRGNVKPMDYFADTSVQLTLDLSLEEANETFTMFHIPVLADCSKYINLTTNSSEILKSPPIDNFVAGETTAECRWVIYSPEGTKLGIKINNIELHSSEQLLINDGNSELKKPLFQLTSFSQAYLKDNYIRSSKNSLWISLMPGIKSTFEATVTSYEKGGFFETAGDIGLKNNKESEVVYLIHVEPTKQALFLLNEQNISFMPTSALHFYNDYNINNSEIAVLRGDTASFPIVATGPKLMIIAKNFNDKAFFSGNFRGVPQGCYQLSTDITDTYLLEGNCNATCYWIIPPNDHHDKVFSLQFFHLDLEDTDVIKIHKLNPVQSNVMNIYSNVTYVPELYLPAESGALIEVTRAVCKQPKKTILSSTFDISKSCDSNLNLDSVSHFQLISPNYPDFYPLLANCWWNFESSENISKSLHLSFMQLDLAENHCIRIYKDNGTDKTIEEIYYGQEKELPSDIIIGSNTSIQFLSSDCKHVENTTTSFITDQGFILNVTAIDCGETITKDHGDFSTPGYPKVVENETMCSWILTVPPPKEKDSVNIIIFKLDIEHESSSDSNYEFTIYDGNSTRSQILKNITGKEIWSRTNTLIFNYKRLNGSSSGINISYHSFSCNKSMQCDNGICMHPDWRCNTVNDCGDWSDEKNCNSIPEHHDTVYKGITTVGLVLGILLSFISGILVALAVPYLIRRYRSERYHQFRDMSAGE